MAAAQTRAEKAATVAEASKDPLVEALDEQVYRERNGIEVADDPAVLAREQAERTAAQQMQREQMDQAARMDEAMARVEVEGFGMG